MIKKFYIVLFFCIFGFVYSFPTFLGEDPVLLINSNKFINFSFADKLKHFYIKNGVKIKSLKITDNVLVFRFFSTEDQFLAYELLKEKKLPVQVSLNILSNNLKIFEKLKAYPMRMGLDLRGGISLSLKVYDDNILKSLIYLNIEKLKNVLSKNKYNVKVLKSKNNKFFKIFFKDKIDIIKIKQFIDLGDFDFYIFSYDSFSLKFKLKHLKEFEMRQKAIDRSIEIISKRILELGISDYVIQQKGVNEIVVEIPGIQDILYAKYILGKISTIKFMLIENNLFSSSNFNKKKYKFLYDIDLNPFILKRKEILNGSSIINANLSFDSFSNMPCIDVLIDFNSSEKFKKITSRNIGKLIAIVCNEKIISDFKEKTKENVVSIARIMSSLGDKFQITGLSLQEAKDLSLILRTGSLPASILILDEQIIGPSLGEKNIVNGIYILFFSIFLVFLFMFLRYKFLGVISGLSLFFNFLILISLMSLLNITLTLACIAGLALTIAFSVDANVLIFERIIEEKKMGFKNYIENGFNFALFAIFDSNITTLLVCLVLLFFSIGSMKFFAIVLFIGVVSSFYSSVFFTKFLIDLFYVKRNIF